MSGMAMISCNDIWGNTSILGNVAPGSVFAEVYACIPGQPMLVTVSAAEDTSVLFMNVGRVLTACTNACPFHTNLARNLLTVCAHKSLQLSQKILHTGSKSIRGRLMSYFSECAKMRKDGIIEYKKIVFCSRTKRSVSVQGVFPIVH